MTRKSTTKLFWLTALVVIMCLAVVGCAPKQADSTAGSTQADTPEMGWSLEIDCMTCHTTQASSMASGDTGAAVHATDATATCISCHNDEATLSGVHANATADKTMPTKLNKSMVSCQSSGCHDLSKDEMLALTADITELTDIEGTMVNPHDVIGLTPGHSEITCASCHQMHKGTDVLAAETCISCHHAGVYTCNTCH